MRLKLLFILFLAGFVYSQQKDQSIELPDFVITGVQSAVLPKINKGMPDFVSSLSNEYLTPTYAPSNFAGFRISNPIEKKYPLFTQNQRYHTWVKAGTGYYTMPKADIFYYHDFSFGKFSAKANGEYTRNYIKNSTSNKQSAEINADFYVKNNSDFLPGSSYNLNAGGERESYSFFASANPTTQRVINSGFFGASLIETYTDVFNIGLKTKDNYISLSNESFSENRISFDGFASLKLSALTIKASGGIVSQQLNDNFVLNDKNTFVYGRAGLQLNASKSVNFKAGFFVAQHDSIKFLSPYASLSFEIDDNLELIAELAPSAKYSSTFDLLKKNKYLNINGRLNNLQLSKGHLNIGIKYEFNKYFSIAGGFESSKNDYVSYFNDDKNKGIFDLESINNVKETAAFFNLLFHPGPFGTFYAELKYSDWRMEDQNIVPYKPLLDMSANYSYLFMKKWKGTVNFEVLKDIYTDLQNSSKIDSFLNLGLEIEYRMNQRFSLFANIQNLLNNKNYLIEGYQEKPIDIIAGIYFRM